MVMRLMWWPRSKLSIIEANATKRRAAENMMPRWKCLPQAHDCHEFVEDYYGYLNSSSMRAELTVSGRRHHRNGRHADPPKPRLLF